MSGTTPSSAATVEYTPEGRPRSLHDAFGLVASPVPTEPGSGDPAVFSQGTAKGSFGPLGARSSPGAPGGSRERRLAHGPAGYLTRGHVVELPTAAAGSAGSNLGMIPELPGHSSKDGICHAADFSALDALREEAQTLQGLLASSQAHAYNLGSELNSAVQQGSVQQVELLRAHSELSSVRREYDDASERSHFQLRMLEDRAEANLQSRMVQLRGEAQSVLLRSTSELEESLMLRLNAEEVSFQAERARLTQLVFQHELAAQEQQRLAETHRVGRTEAVGQSQLLSSKLGGAENEVASLQRESRELYSELLSLRDGAGQNDSEWQQRVRVAYEQAANARRESQQAASLHASEVEALKHRFGHAEGLLHRESGTAQRLRESAVSYRSKLTHCERELENSTASLQMLNQQAANKPNLGDEALSHLQ